MSWSLKIALVATMFVTAVAPAQDAFVPHQLLVRLDPSIPDVDQRQVVRSLGLSVRTHYDLLRMWWVDCPKHWDVLEKAEELAADPRVVFAHANYYGRRVGRVSPVIPNDPQFGNCWGLNNTGQAILGSVGTNDADIDAPEAWCLRTDASAVVIAVIDSGCLKTHQDLVGNIWQNPADPVNGVDDDGNGLIDDINGWDYLAGDNDPEDLDGHGTNVIGVCSMTGDNGVGGTGVCWQSSVMILKDGNSFPQAALSALAMQYVAAHNVAVVNFSTGYPAAAQSTISTGVNALQAAGVIMTVSAGNGGGNIEGGTLDVPAELTQDNLFVIAASNNSDGRATFSGFGPISVDIAAPGEGILTTTRIGGYGFVSGTSFSAPMAAGCVALVRAQNTSLSHTAVISLLMNNADTRPAWNNLTVSGARINLNDALQATPPPTPQYQTNASAASLDVNGVAGTSAAPAIVTTNTATSVSLGLVSFLQGNAWDLGYGTAPLIPASAGALTSSDGQIVNLDLADPNAGTWFNVMQTSPPFTNLSLPSVTFPVPQSISAQMIVVSPATSSGITLSQPVQLIVQ